jgi:hypothetical protein
MGIAKDDRPNEKSKSEYIKIIAEEAKYRPIVPFLGAGISISAGFPTIKFVIDYLAKVSFAIEYGIFEDRLPNIKPEDKSKLKSYFQRPSQYLDTFGWPNLGQLNADIWDWLSDKGKEKIFEKSERISKKTIEGKLPDLLALDIISLPALDIILQRKLEEIDDDQKILLKNYIDGKKYIKLNFRHYQQAIVQWVLRKEHAGHEINTEQAILEAWLNWKKYHNSDQDTDLEHGLLYGDWEALLDKLCEGHFNLADGLFTLFEQGLKPTLSHRYLSFLQSKLGMPLLLTTNFDSLLERAFNQEDIHPKVFDIHRDAELPDATLVCKQLSLLKLHGSAYGLKFGERLKHSLEASDRNTATAYIPIDALILVMGFSGSERRIMQMLLAFVQQVESESKDSDTPRLIWIQGPGEPGPLFNEMLVDYKNIVKRVNVKHIDTFIQELYFHITRHSYPSSVKNYSTIPNQPLTKGLKNALSEKEDRKRCPVQLYIDNHDNKNRTPPYSSWPSLAAMEFVKSLNNGYTSIWIDFESHHTIEGIISEIFNRVRVIDPQAPLFSLGSIEGAEI